MVKATVMTLTLDYYKGDSANQERGQWRREGGGNGDTKKRDYSSKKPKLQAKDGENIDCIPPQAFVHQRKERHLQLSMPKKYVLEELKKN